MQVGQGPNIQKKICIKSDQLQLSFKMFRIKTNAVDIQQAKDVAVARLNSYLENNNG